ncbi:MAG: GntP family permease [Oscillospiraceae bacterium]
MSTTGIIITFVVCIIVMIVLIAQFHVNAVMALILVSMALGIIIGTPLGDVMNQINTGFSSTIKKIAIIILLGSLLGKILEETGAAQSLTFSLVKLVGKKNVIWAIGISAFILAVPVFSDTVTILLMPIVSNLAIETGASMMTYGTALAVCAQITHCLVAPTPGPIAAASLVGVPLGVAIPWGLLVSVPGLFVTILYCKIFCTKEMVAPKEEHLVAYEANKNMKLPNVGLAVLPIILPVVLIVCNTVINTIAPDSVIGNFFLFFGAAEPALLIGCIIAAITLTEGRWKTKLVLNDWVDTAMEVSAMPVFVTGAGGALAQFIKNSGVADVIAASIVDAGFPAILVPIILSAIIHVVTGSSTLAVATTGALVAPMLATLGLSPLSAFLAICSAALMFKHGNSSAFWVGTSLSNMTFPQGLKGIGGGCTVASFACCITTVILYAVGII